MPLTEDLLLQVHRLMTDKTMQHPDDAGRFRSNNEVVVENGITHEVVHIPPSYEEIPRFVGKLCRFFNEKKAASVYLRTGDFNERQAQIIQMFAEDQAALITVKDLQIKFGISPTTAKSDIVGLLNKGIVSEIALNKVKRAYVKGGGLAPLLSKETILTDKA